MRKIALIGNPNSGKTTIFNSLTKSYQKVGNYPGVTLERKEGLSEYKDTFFQVIDLPGIYGLSHYSLEEVIARNAILEEKPDIIVNILDASNLERALFITTQLIEFGIPVILVLNMMDVVDKKKIQIDKEKLSLLLECDMVEVVGTKESGIERLKEIVHESRLKVGAKVRFSHELEESISLVQNEVEKIYPQAARFISIKLLEGDSELANFLKIENIFEKFQHQTKLLEEKFGSYLEILTAEERHSFISAICKKSIITSKGLSFSDKVDSVLLHKWLGLPIFILLIFSIFQATFRLGYYPSSWLETFFRYLSSFFSKENLWSSFVADGLIAGMGAVLTFLPNILILFFALTLLEESGYMARAAFLMDKLMHKIGLHGKSFIPMLLGFGCTVPAIMSSRMLENKKDRLILILILPFIACSAKFTIFTLLAGAFFPKNISGLILFSLYLIGFILATIVIKILKRFVFKGEEMPFILELPEYRLPSLKNLYRHLYWLTKQYLKKAGTIIALFSFLLWVLNRFPTQDNSFMLMTGKLLEPLFLPLGFDWRICTALLAALVAKEVFIAQMGILFALSGTTSLMTALQSTYSPSQAFSLMIFFLISMPCMGTFAVVKKETRSWKWPFLQFGLLTLFAYAASFIIYQLLQRF